VAIQTTTPSAGAPISTKLVVWLGMLLVGVGFSMAIADQIRTTSTPTSPKVTSPALDGSLPVPGALFQLVQLVPFVIVGVCVVGFLVVARGVTARR
jgi:hypothetical protein